MNQLSSCSSDGWAVEKVENKFYLWAILQGKFFQLCRTWRLVLRDNFKNKRKKKISSEHCRCYSQTLIKSLLSPISPIDNVQLNELLCNYLLFSNFPCLLRNFLIKSAFILHKLNGRFAGACRVEDIVPRWEKSCCLASALSDSGTK